MLKSESERRHPFFSLVLLLLLMMTGAMIFTVLAFAIGSPVFGLSGMMATQGELPSIPALRLLQTLTSTGMFIVPALLFAWLERTKNKEYLQFNSFPAILFLLSILLMFCSSPILEWSSTLNKSMKLPESLKGIEAWMLLKEQEMSMLTKQFLKMDSIGILLINLLMLAIIPALGEEFIFRGCLQKIFGRWTGNDHAAIWITAIIFSAIHFQFYGFIPRMLLGALFGYLLVWSRTIWIPVLAHFINNSVAVITAYVYQQKGISLDKLDHPDPVSSWVYISSFVITAALLWIFYTTSRKYGMNESKITDGARMD
jgi:membrane protease YdiL (CAAX protease family)